ncbi:uncharacterized protein TrAtP1_007592 [Trichoderma atroviride]|uniref:uncharacterized protein n=1 Tax=Hypocrea atroviridis TaxID=63577 RepID=UPI003321D4CD|nr:hypothetical protein TrAtP1_007592 [Trichoderma atroviride]
MAMEAQLIFFLLFIPSVADSVCCVAKVPSRQNVKPVDPTHSSSHKPLSPRFASWLRGALADRPSTRSSKRLGDLPSPLSLTRWKRDPQPKETQSSLGTGAIARRYSRSSSPCPSGGADR